MKNYGGVNSDYDIANKLYVDTNNNAFKIDIVDGVLKFSGSKNTIELIKDGKLKLKLFRRIASRHIPCRCEDNVWTPVLDANRTKKGYIQKGDIYIDLVEDDILHFEGVQESIYSHNEITREILFTNKKVDGCRAGDVFAINTRRIINSANPRGTNRRSITWGARPIPYEDDKVYILNIAIGLENKVGELVASLYKLRVLMSNNNWRFIK